MGIGKQSQEKSTHKPDLVILTMLEASYDLIEGGNKRMKFLRVKFEDAVGKVSCDIGHDLG